MDSIKYDKGKGRVNVGLTHIMYKICRQGIRGGLIEETIRVSKRLKMRKKSCWDMKIKT